MINPFLHHEFLRCPSCGSGLSWGHTTEIDEKSKVESCISCGTVLGDGE